MSADASPAGDATALAQAIVRGERSARDVLVRTLRAVAAINPRLNAVALLRPEAAERRAERLDRELAACRGDAARTELLRARPFFGVPLLLKDVGAAARELPSRLGSRLGARLAAQPGQLHPDGIEWPVDSVLVERYVAAGFVLFGRSTSPEMGISPSTEAVVYGGATRNPWQREHSAGGSSGGAAAAVASGMVAIAHANDGAGSIRIPAACCGLIGLKPSRGLMPMGPLVGEAWGGLAVDHMLTRSVRDCALALDVSAGADTGAPYAAPARPASFVREATTPLRPLRIALCNQTFDGEPVHAEVAATVAAFAGQMERLGHIVETARPPVATRELVQAVMQIVACGTAMTLDDLAARRGRPVTEDELEPVTWSALGYGRRLSGTDYLRAVGTVHQIGRRMARFHEDFDLLLTPTLAEPPASLGRWAMNQPDFIEYRLGAEGIWRYSPFTPLANATGGPSISLPAGVSALGLPIGAMLGAALGGDALLLQLAAQWEAANPGAVPLAPAPQP